MYMEDDGEGDSGDEFITVNKSKHRRRRKADGSTEKLAKKAIDVETSKHCSDQSKLTPNQVPAIKPKTKSKKQKTADQRRRDKADIVDKQKRPEEVPPPTNTSADKKPNLLKEKDISLQAKEAEDKLEKPKKATAAPASVNTKQKSSPVSPEPPSPSTSPRSFPARELPPRFAHKKMATPQGPKKTGDARIGHWTGWEPHNDAIDPNMDLHNSLGWSHQSLAASLKANQFWSGPDMVSQSHGEGRDIGTWHNPEGAWGSNPSKPQSNEIIVDTQDREAWPSIGNSDSASDAAADSDNASVKSASVISMSSNAGQGSNTLSDSSGQAANAIKTQTNSASVWAPSFSGDSSHGTWASPATNQIAGGWGSSGQGDGFPGALSTSGAQTQSNSGAQVTSTQQLNVAKGMSWQGMGSGEPRGSSWGDISAGSNVIATGLNVSSPAGSNPNMDQWRNASGAGNGSSLGWGEAPVPPPAKTEPTGWGSPSGSPVPNAGTDAWGAPNKSVPQQWSNQAMPPVPAPGWGNQESKTPPASGGAWGDSTEIKPSGSWAVDTNNRPPSRGWGTPDTKPQTPNSPSVWATDSEQRPSSTSQSQWGGGAANPQSQWGAPDSGAAAGPPQSTPANPSSGPAVWAASPPKKEPPPQPFPSTWAQAAGKGIVTAPKPEVLTEEQKREQLIVAAINSQECWGKRPIRQDTSWEVEEPRPAPPPPVRRNSGSEPDGSHWNQNNNGTAIWEASKTNQSGWTSARSGASSGTSSSGSGEWGGSDNDGGHWNGPPGSTNNNANNTWNGPPNSNQWGGQWNDQKERAPQSTWGGNAGPAPKTWNGGSSGSGGSSHSGGKDDQHWSGSPKEDNVWDRNGTSAWGSNGGGGGSGSGSGSGGPGKTEIGTWVDPNRQRRGSNSSNEWTDVNSTTWDGAAGGANPSPIDNGTHFWGEPQKTNNWSSPNTPSNAMPPHMPPQRSMSQGEGLDKGSPYWNQSQHPSKSAGWGDPMGPSGPKVEDGSGVWNSQMQNKAWEQSQWSSGAKPKTSSTSSWDANDWNQQAKKGAIYPNSGRSQNPPQMRSKLLQQLVEMGFKREDAQNALISNNMSMESAIADLIQGANKRPPDFDLDEKARKLRGMGMDQMPPDPQADPSQLVPPMSNTPFSSAQNTMPNPQMMLNLKGASLQNMSSLNNFSNAASINQTLQQKLLQQQLQQQNIPQGQAIRGPLAPQNVQQQLMQQQIMQQLRMAVQAGLISPQLLNQQLTPTLRIMVQQLLQLQETYNRLIANQQILQQQLLQPTSKPNPMAQRQLDQLLITIPKVKQQILTIQQQITQTQQPLPKPPRGLPIDPKELTEKLSNLSMTPRDNMHPMMMPPQQQVQPPAQQQPIQAAQQAQSRLNQWKLPSPEKESDQALNKAPGSKPLSQSQSNPNLTADLKTSSSSLLYDTTWSTTPTSATTTNPSWPSPNDAKENSKENASNKESRTTPSPGEGSNPSASTSSASPAATTTSNEDSSSALPDIGIPEFVPGKPWQGLSTKNVEDDPYITPGSVTRPSLSVNTIKDDYVMTTLGKPSSPSVTDASSPSSTSWSSFSLGKNMPKSTWSSSNSLSDNGSLASELWGVRRPPPGLTNQPKGMTSASWQQGANAGFNRSMSWAGGERSSFPTDSGWGGQVNCSYLLLKNLSPQIDSSTLRTLCTQHGPLVEFYPKQQYALVRYNTKEEAQKAQRALNACVLGNTAIVAEFVSDEEAQRLMMQSQQQPTSMWSQAPNPAPPQYGYRPPTSAPAAHWGGNGPWSGGGGLWAIDDLSSDMLN